MTRTLVQVAVCLVILGLAAGGVYLMIKNKPEAKPDKPTDQARVVRVESIEPEDITLTVRAYGSVQPRAQIQLMAEVAGRVQSIADGMVTGGFFAAGDILVQLDNADYLAAVEAAKAEVSRAERQLMIEQAEAETAIADWKAESPTEPAPPLVARKPQIAEAEATLAAAKASRTKAELDRDRTTIRAPFDGRVRTESVDVGQYVMPGTALAAIYAIDYVEVRLPISDEDLAFVDLPLGGGSGSNAEAGPSVEFSAWFGGKTATWHGEIVRTEGEIDPRTRMVYAVARVADPYQRQTDRSGPPLSIGMFVTADIRGRELAGAYRIPRSVLYDRDKVLVVDEDDRVRIVELTILRRSANHVIARGSLFGRRLILSRMDAYTDGMRVQPVDADAAGARSSGQPDSETPDSKTPDSKSSDLPDNGTPNEASGRRTGSNGEDAGPGDDPNRTRRSAAAPGNGGN